MADFMGMMKQAAQLQAKVQEMQAELEQVEVEGVAGGGGGGGRLGARGGRRGVSTDGGLLKGEEKDTVEDVIRAANADARRKAEAVMQEKMKTLTGGLPLPPGLKLF